MSALARSIVLAIALSGGCGGASHAVAQPAPAIGSSAAWLAWGERGDGVAETRWLDARGTELASRDGIVIAHGGALYRLETETERPRLPTCEQLESEEAESPRGERARLVRASLVELGGSRRITLAEPAETSGEASVEQEVELVASLGPYVFVRSSIASFACGAHGNVQAFIQAIDLTTGAAIELLSPRDEERTAALADRALLALTAEGGDALDVPIDAASIRRAASLPALERGRVVTEHVFETDVCYACSDPSWSSYTRAATVREDALLERLAPYASLPDGVSRALTERTGVRGVSAVTADDAARLLLLFRSNPI